MELLEDPSRPGSNGSASSAAPGDPPRDLRQRDDRQHVDRRLQGSYRRGRSRRRRRHVSTPRPPTRTNSGKLRLQHRVRSGNRRGSRGPASGFWKSQPPGVGWTSACRHSTRLSTSTSPGSRPWRRTSVQNASRNSGHAGHVRGSSQGRPTSCHQRWAAWAGSDSSMRHYRPPRPAAEEDQHGALTSHLSRSATAMHPPTSLVRRTPPHCDCRGHGSRHCRWSRRHRAPRDWRPASTPGAPDSSTPPTSS